ncbi:MAG: hypothetical protein CALGDGBN_00001 [Pseudomonadales bacterium]|nr:hypothetical protein [Pseudomonadales bacterium]
MPAATFASATASASVLPAASAAARVAITVSPAPVTSKTSMARAGRCSASPAARTSVMPRSPRVISSACNPSSHTSAPALASRSASDE